MTEIVEEVAEEVEKVAEEVEKKLPGDSKFKESLDSIENLAKGAVKYANQAQDIIHKVGIGEIQNLNYDGEIREVINQLDLLATYMVNIVFRQN
ncbi:hypothetical protein T459_15051 [Capsicum annuum]|uniref:Uncharacterized protein n=1 Tax=Capsicum annuum TaxID=4072 RepID=A0A2G2ZJ87_CAPAN|nr:hypothetical protein FXO37_25942 [Capsicum annuum]PHT82036.1 hypothetical protein T459_15051 [Capsicum annuum]